MASCSDGDDESSKTIELTGGTQTTQTVFADETTLHNGIKFTATEAWTATITEVATTKAGCRACGLGGIECLFGRCG